jgi:hypothetical protein
MAAHRARVSGYVFRLAAELSPETMHSPFLPLNHAPPANDMPLSRERRVRPTRAHNHTHCVNIRFEFQQEMASMVHL